VPQCLAHRLATDRLASPIPSAHDARRAARSRPPLGILARPSRHSRMHPLIGCPSGHCLSTPFCAAPPSPPSSVPPRAATRCAPSHYHGPVPTLPRIRGSGQASLNQHGLQPDTVSHSPNQRRPHLPHTPVATAAVSTTRRAPSHA
jgi:hypothetical protein